MKALGRGWAAVGTTLLPAVLALVACGGVESDVRPTPAGDELVIVTPTPATPAAAGGEIPEQMYVVREGDTLSGIAARFGVAEGALQAANDLTDANRLVIGQRLVIPVVEP